MQGLWKETGRNISLQPKNILDSRQTVLETILDDAVPKKCAAGPKTKFNPLVVILLFIEHTASELSPPVVDDMMKSFIRVEKNQNKKLLDRKSFCLQRLLV